MSVKSRRTCVTLTLVCLMLTGGCTRAKPALDIVSEVSGLVSGAKETVVVTVGGDSTNASTPEGEQPTSVPTQPAVLSTPPLADAPTLDPALPTHTITPWPTFTPFPMSDTPMPLAQSTPLLGLTQVPSTFTAPVPGLTLEPTPVVTQTPVLLVPTVLIASETPGAASSPTTAASSPTTAASSPTTAASSPTTAASSPTTAASSPTISATEIITQDVTYTVSAGDTLLAISQHYGTSVDAIANRNGLVSKNAIYAGQELVIPAGYGPDDEPPPMVVSHTVLKGETLSSISRQYRTTPSEIVSQNAGAISDPNSVSPGTVLSITVGTAPVQIVHTVRPGDSVASIARRYGVSIKALVDANAIRNPNRLRVGTVLLIPR